MLPLTVKEQRARQHLCLPLDNLHSLQEVKERVQELSPYVGLFKIGKGSFTRFGPEVIRVVQEYGANVFLDLKYHDIPETVRDASQAAAEQGVYMFNVHAAGGKKMMEAAVQGAIAGTKAGYSRPKIIAVTLLTSINQETFTQELRGSETVEEHVCLLAQLAQTAGVDGIVCSAQDLPTIRSRLRSDFMYVTPGIKGPQTAAGSDQARVETPGNAIKNGATILVVGRAITTAADRPLATYQILQDMAQYL